MTELRSTLTALLLIAAVAACGDAPDQADQAEDRIEIRTEEVPEWVIEVAVVADEIEAQPAAADSILIAHDMSRDQLDSLLYVIAEDTILIAAYRDARDR